MFIKNLIVIMLCMVAFPAMANHPEFESYKIGGAILIALFITVVFIKPLKTKNWLLKAIIAIIVFLGISSFTIGLAYIYSMFS